MNSRERFLATMTFEKPDRALLWEFGYWGGTIERWYKEGLPKRSGLSPAIGYGHAAYAEGGSWDESERLREFDVHDALGLDEGLRRISMNNFICPWFEPMLLEDHGEWVVRTDEGESPSETEKMVGACRIFFADRSRTGRIGSASRASDCSRA